VTADHYRVLGVAPGAEDAVIRAAYRALMRMYHPDTNDDPLAQSRVRDITAAFAVLGDPDRRAAYDAGQIFGGAGGERAWVAADRRSPPMRAARLASIAIAIAVTLAFALPKSQQALEPQALRDLAAYRGITDSAPASEAVAAPTRKSAESAIAPPSASPAPPPLAVPPPAPAPRAASEPALDRELPARPRPATPVDRPKATVATVVRQSGSPALKPVAAPNCSQCSDRRAQVERLAAGFLKQSLDHADWQKQQLLLSARNRAAVSRTMCRSDDCVTEAYLRQIRDTTTIMEGRIPNP
jgi:curved DNA-binding protein CbpA